MSKPSTPTGETADSNYCGIKVSLTILECAFAFYLKPNGTGTMADIDEGLTVSIDHSFANDVATLLQHHANGDNEKSDVSDEDDLNGERYLVVDDGTSIVRASSNSTLYDELYTAFFEEYNDLLDEDKVIDPHAYDDEFHVNPPHTVESYCTLMKTVVLAWKLTHKDDEDFTVSSNPDCDEHNPPDDMDDLLRKIDRIFGPSGSELEYNDGSVNRESGYSANIISYEWDSNEVWRESSPRDRVGAVKHLVDQLQPLGIDLFDICPAMKPPDNAAA